MRAIPDALAASLATGATTLARCWRLTRADGAILGFTDHDRDIAVDGLVCSAGSGLEAAEAEVQLGFAVGGSEVQGALVSPGLSEDDLAAGRWDAARVEVWLVDWADPDTRLLLSTGTVGEVRRAGSAFTAEVRGPATVLDEERGRIFGSTCDADLGDARCGVDLGATELRAEAVITATDGRSGLSAAALAGREEGLFTGGRLTFTSGANAGWSVEVRRHRAATGAAALELWRETGLPMAAGDAFHVTAGCDRRFATCRDRFNNVRRFRGFPHMPGTDFVMRVARQGQAVMDGGSLFR
jgi:uncharacterized phage protein (TIGR02218 family)